MSEELRACFEDIKDCVNAAMAHYQIWFTLRGSGKAIEKDQHYNDMNDFRYVDFFHAACAGHYKLMFIETGCIFDTDDRTNRLRRLKEIMTSNGLANLANKITNNLLPYKNLVSNMLTIRSKLMAHKETGVEPKDLYAKHGIRPDDIKSLLNTLAELLRELESVINNDDSSHSVGVTDRWENATYGLLETLQNGRRP